MRIIGLNGRKGSGKNTVGDYLEREYGFQCVSYAAKLKASAAALLDVPVSLLETYKNDPKAQIVFTIPVPFGDDLPYTVVRTLTVREYLQRYGTEAHRDIFSESFWRDNLFCDLDPDGSYAITDARFDDELRVIREKGGQIWRVERPGTDVGDAHASEADPDPDLVDFTLDNSGDYEFLYRQVDVRMGGGDLI